MPCEEYDKWMLYLQWKQKQEEKHRKEYERKNKNNSGRMKGSKRVVTY